MSLSLLIRLRFVICSWKINRSDDSSKGEKKEIKLVIYSYFLKNQIDIKCLLVKCFKAIYWSKSKILSSVRFG
jgi:hypothetical protein